METVNLDLTEHEKVAKDYVLNLMFKGLSSSEPCDTCITDEHFQLPRWYDDTKFKRGQKYFKDNRAGIMLSNLYGLFSLICEPNGAKLLDRTQQSSTPETAKKRYISTTLGMLSWYEDELKPGSKSWESLKRVRKMHLMASRAAAKGGYDVIPQCAMAMTKFGFMGFALVKPHMLGIRHDNREDREAFVHFWAVIGAMLGIKDEFNMCLFPLEVVETICHIFIRYAFNPFLQLETPTFEKLGRAFIQGLRVYLMFPTYESRLFLARRLVGIHGYQYDIDNSKEHFQKQIFTAEELQRFRDHFQNKPGFEYRRNFVFDEKMHVLEVRRGEKASRREENNNSESQLDNVIVDGEKNARSMAEFLELKSVNEMTITDIDDNQHRNFLSDKKFKDLSMKNQFLVKVCIHQVRMLTNKFTKPLYEMGLNVLLFAMKKHAEYL